MRGLLMCVVMGMLAVWGQAGENKPVQQIKTTEKIIALTFDDGPDESTLKMLELFAREGVTATFFVVGAKAEKLPEIVKKTAAAGCEIGNHSFTHANLTKLDDAKLREEIVKTQTLLQEKCGVTPKVFRAPYLAYDARMWGVLNELGLPGINAMSSTGDWDKNVTVDQIVERATVKAGPGGIVLMHSWPVNTLAALPAIIKYYKENGYRFVTVSQLLAAQAK